jgi:hypothetical protein
MFGPNHIGSMPIPTLFRQGSVSGAGGAPFSNRYALELDGVDQFIRFGNPALDPLTISLNNTTTEGTLSFWVYLDNLTGNHYIYEKGVDGNNNFRLFHNGSYLYLSGSYLGSITVFNYYAGVVSAATWHMITITYTTATTTPIVRLYVDGSLAVATFSFPVGTTNGLDPGGKGGFAKTYASPTYSQQIVDEIAVWDTALSAAEILELYTYHDLATDSGNYTSSADLLRWWRLEDNRSEETGNGADLDLANSPSYVTNVPFSS